ncbi:MAG: glycosyltransferase [Lachnospiraceae bacterium]|nr:glycosyltransferase [Lachnospiraceae bacterium]
MKVIEINSISGIQSTGRIVSNIKRELISKGHECLIAYGEQASTDIEGNYHIGSEIDRYIHALKSRLFDTTGFESIRSTKKFISCIDAYQPDVVHIHNLHGYYINVDILFEYLAKKNIPVVWTLHDCWPFTGHCAHFMHVKCYKWKNGCFDCEQTHEYPTSWIIDRSKDNYIKKKNLFTAVNNLHIVTPSKWLESVVKESFLKNAQIHVINNGVNIEIFKPGYEMKLGEEFSDKKIVLAVSSVWTDLKGYSDLKKIQCLLDKKKYKLVVIGVSQKQQDELSRENIFSIIRTESQVELAKWYDKAFAFINPTYEDTFPTVNIESLASGTPIITYMTGGSPELVYDKCGVVVSVGDYEGMVKALDGLEKNSELCRSYGKNYCMLNMYKRYVELIEDVATEKNI